MSSPGSASVTPRLSPKAAVCVLLAPAAVFFAVLWATHTRSPILDDFDYLFPFAVQFQKTAGLGHKLLLLVTTQVGAYKAVSVYALLELQLAVLGHLSFPFMIVLGNLTIAGIFAVIARNLLRLGAVRRNLLFLLPVSLLIFNLNDAELLNWAVAGISPPMLVLLALLSIHFLVHPDRSAKNIVLAAAAACLASFTVINGLLLWPVGVLFLLLEERRPLRWVVWLAAAALTGFVCFFHYQTAGLTVPSSVASKLLFFAMLCGGAIENMHHRPLPYISLAIGVFGIGAFVTACVSRFDRRSPFVLYSMLWVVLTGLMIATARASMGVTVSLSSRYKIYCDLLLIFSYAFLSGPVRAIRCADEARLGRWSRCRGGHFCCG